MADIGRTGLFPAKFTLTIEEHSTLGWVVTSDAHKGFMQVIMPEEGLPEGLRQVPANMRRLMVAQMDADIARTKRPTWINMSPPVECYSCHQIRPPFTSVNIMMNAAGSVPSTMKPLCEECSPTFKTSF